MRFLNLHLLAYGPFTDTKLDLSAGKFGLHIVYGPNEAGKSSALRAIRGMLYGIPPICRDNHLHDYKHLRIGGTIENIAGDQIAFLRRKANKDSLLNPRHAQGAAYPSNALQPYLGGIDEATFKRVYGIGHMELRRGGNEMQSLKGLVGESLFAATVGGSGLADVMANLETEASEIFDTTKRRARLKLDAKQYKELQRERRESRLSSGQWSRLQESLEKDRQRRDEIVRHAQAAKKKLSRLQRIAQALGVIGRRDQAVAEIEKLPAARILPDSYDTENRIRVESELKRVSAVIDDLTDRLTGPESLPAQIENIEIVPGLVDCEDRISALQNQCAVHLKAVRDQTQLRRDCENARVRAGQLMRELGLDGTLADVERFRLTVDERTKIQTLANDQRSLRERPGKINQQIASLACNLDDQKSRRQQLGGPRDISVLRHAVDQVAQMGDLQAAKVSAADALADIEQQAAQQLASLDLWSASLSDTLSVRVPLLETVNRFAQHFDKLQSDSSRLTEEGNRLTEELIQAQESIVALEQTGHVPTERELDDLRAARDGLWQQIVVTERVTGEVAAEYESVLQQADLIADRLRREAERVAQLGQRRAAVAALKQRIERNRESVADLQQQHGQFEHDWNAQWQPVGIAMPLPPREMLAWLTRLSDLRHMARAVAQQQAAVQKCAEKLTNARAQVSAALLEVGETPAPHGTLARLLDQSRIVLSQEAELADQLEELDREIERLESEVQQRQREQQVAQQEFDQWQAAWHPAMEKLGMDVMATAEQANVRISRIEELFGFIQEVESKEKRIRDMDADSRAFESDAHELARRFLSADADAPATEIATMLKMGLDQTKKGLDAHERLSRELEQTREARTTANKSERDLRRQLEELLRMAGTTDTAVLPEIERESRELHQWQRRLEEAEEQLYELCGNIPVDEFVSEASQWDHDDLTVEISEIEAELVKLESSRDEAVAAVTESQAEVDAADGSARAAEIDQAALGVITGMHRHVQRYMQLKLASHMLRQQIEEYRAENEDPLLERANTLFERMTRREFSGLRTDYDGDRPVIMGVRKSGDTLVPVDAMSDGTRDQLYLALRLAYVEKQLMDHEPMPFIVDDILIHFDDKRSLATLEVLTELSKQTQVIFFTHHTHLAELATANLPSDECYVHHPGGPARDFATAGIATSRPR